MIDPTLPFIDLHRHLDGNVRLETILDLGRQHNLSLPSYRKKELRSFVQITEPAPGVMAFIEKMKWMVGVLVDYDACFRVAYENVEDAKDEGLDYVELRFSPWFMSEPHGLHPEGVVEAVVEGVDQGRQIFKMQVNLIGIISRTYGPRTGWKELQALLTQKDHLVGLDLAGDEAGKPGELFVDHFARAREVGWKATIHAGEARGADSVWQAVRGLGANRIGHATHAVEDHALMDMLVERKIGVEVNLTSNIQTTTVPNLSSHPMRQLLDWGVLATINTDDPGVSGINLRYEYEVAAPAAGLTRDQIRQAQRNALEVAFLSVEEKNALLEAKKSNQLDSN
jgi:adenosine deaminase